MDNSINRSLRICIIMLIGIIGNVRSQNVVSVKETEPITLSCIAHDPTVNGKMVKWYKGPQMVSIDRLVTKFRTSLQILPSPPPNEWNLKILRVTKEFEDEYTCKVNDVPQNIVRVVVEAEPTIVDAESSPLTVIKPEYTDVVLKCKVEGYPKALIFWSRKSRGEGGSIKDLGIHTETLTIVNATRYADDIYICMAENTYGSVQREISVRILFEPEVVLFEPEAESAKGKRVTMACMVRSSPLQDSYWKNENGDRLNSNFKYIVDVETDPVNQARFMTLTLREGGWNDADYGQYSCNVSNGTLTAVKQFTLKRPADVDETVIKYDVR